MTSSNERQKQTLRDLLRNMTLFTLIIISLSAELTSALWVSNNFFVGDKRCEKILEKRHGDPIYESTRKHGLYSEKNLFAECFLYKFTEKSGRDLYLDGLYIAGHKYFGKDPRSGKRGFFRKFPSPHVAIDRSFRSQVRLQEECQKSGKDCVRAVYVYGGRKSGTVQNFLVSYGYCPVTGLGSLVGRVSASRSGGTGFDPGPRHTKNVINGTSCSPLGTRI